MSSVFLVLSPNRFDAYSRWLRLLVAEALQDIARDAERSRSAERPSEPRCSLLNGICENGGGKFVHGSGGLVLLRAA